MKKNKILLALSLPALIFGAVACNQKGSPKETPKYTEDSYLFETIFTNTDSFTFDKYSDLFPENCKSVVYNINKSIGGHNYLKIELETDCNLVGWITYVDETDEKKTNTEKFYIEAGKTEFKTFLDAYRESCYGGFKKKKITKLEFKSVDSTKNGTMKFKTLGHSDREINTERMYIDDGTLRFGTSVKFGGSIEYLERIDIYVTEYLDSGRNVRIDRDVDPSSIDSSRLISKNVNMVNIYDFGREIQPSYYLKVDKETNGYDPKTKYNYESITGSFSYNPIQCGGVGDPKTNYVVGAQIIDYEYKPDHIYIKTKGQDWMFENDQAEGYIESYYHFGDDGLLITDNTYVDFYGFKGLNSVNNPMSGQETPATYFVYPLNYFYIKTKNRTIFDPFVGEQGHGHVAFEDPASSGEAETYYWAVKSQYLANHCDWMAYVNDQKFGAGIFMPNADYYIASRGHSSCKYTDSYNSGYFKGMYDFGDKLTPSYAAMNYNYMNPQLRRRMVEYVPLTYSYAIFIGDVDEMDVAFTNVREQGLTNESLTSSEGTWPRV